MSDPTMQGTPPGTTAARYSLAEIDSQCRKAARGAGCPWGLAEEAGKAARWLAARGLPGPESLAALLEAPRNCPCSLKAGLVNGDSVRVDSEKADSEKADSTEACSAQAGGPECALRFGTLLSDQVEKIVGGETMSGEVAQPLLVLAQLGRAATATGATLTIDWTEGRAHFGPEGLSIEISGELLPAATTMQCKSGRAELPSVSAEYRSRPVAASAWATLERYAGYTYAPATEASRLAGAGAGTLDND